MLLKDFCIIKLLEFKFKYVGWLEMFVEYLEFLFWKFLFVLGCFGGFVSVFVFFLLFEIYFILVLLNKINLVFNFLGCFVVVVWFGGFSNIILLFFNFLLCFFSFLLDWMFLFIVFVLWYCMFLFRLFSVLNFKFDSVVKDRFLNGLFGDEILVLCWWNFIVE